MICEYLTKSKASFSQSHRPWYQEKPKQTYLAPPPLPGKWVPTTRVLWLRLWGLSGGPALHDGNKPQPHRKGSSGRRQGHQCGPGTQDVWARHPPARALPAPAPARRAGMGRAGGGHWVPRSKRGQALPGSSHTYVRYDWWRDACLRPAPAGPYR